MPLHRACELLLDRIVFVQPSIGSGWQRRRADLDMYESGEAVEPPSPFPIQIREFVTYAGEIQGGLGVITDSRHPLNGWWAGFCVRDALGKEFFDLSDRIAAFNIRIGELKPSISIQPETLPMPEWIQFPANSSFSGTGFITQRDMSLEEILAASKS
jgi:hypothetical protein